MDAICGLSIWCAVCEPSCYARKYLNKQKLMAEFNEENNVIEPIEEKPVKQNIKPKDIDFDFNVNPKNILPEELHYKPKQSSGELAVEEYLLKHKMKYLKQYTFDDCRDINPLRFDFAVIKKSKTILIEYDGEQHTQPVKFSRKVNSDKLYFDNIRHDTIKTEYCKQRKIKLIRISYKDKDRINEILDSIFKRGHN